MTVLFKYITKLFCYHQLFLCHFVSDRTSWLRMSQLLLSWNVAMLCQSVLSRSFLWEIRVKTYPIQSRVFPLETCDISCPFPLSRVLVTTAWHTFGNDSNIGLFARLTAAQGLLTLACCRRIRVPMDFIPGRCICAPKSPGFFLRVVPCLRAH